MATSNEVLRTPGTPDHPRTPGASATKVPDPLPEETKRLLRWLVQRSGRVSGLPLGEPFLRSDERLSAYGPPVARMLRGGRSGEVRLKLYLSMSLLATRAPYDVSHIPARAWAQILNLADPTTNGARRVNEAIAWLDTNHFVRAKRGRGAPGTIVMLHQSGSGADYVRPGGRWVQVPLGFWENGWIVHLGGTAVALLLILLDLQGGRQVSQSIVPSEARARYGLSPDTWTKGTKELQDLGLLRIGKAPQGDVWDFRRLRNTYWVYEDRLRLPPGAEAEDISKRSGEPRPRRRRRRRVSAT